MCSRYTLTSPPGLIAKLFQLDAIEDFPPRYNIAPTQPVPIVRVGAHRRRELALVRWGLVPGWVKDPNDFATLINARSETATEKPSFRAAMKYRRCLFPADGFYEWSGPRNDRRPWLIKPRPSSSEGGLMALAGLWEHWMGADGSEFESAAILTTKANKTVSAVHDRMPAIINPDHFDAWLDVNSTPADMAAALLGPAPDDFLEMQPISKRLNNPRIDRPDLLQPEDRQLFS